MGQKRNRLKAVHALSCIVIAGWAVAAAVATEATAAPTTATNTISTKNPALETSSLENEDHRRLAVIVPAHRGDLSRAVSSLGRWPTECSPVTQKNVDVVLYYAEGVEDTAASDAVETIAATAGRCFANTRIVYANLDGEVRVRTDNTIN